MRDLHRMVQQAAPRWAPAALLAAGVAASTTLHAAPGTSTGSATVTVLASAPCYPIGMDMSLIYQPTAAHKTAPLDATASSPYYCPPGTTFTVTLGQGRWADAGSSDAAPLRRARAVLANGTFAFLSYQVYRDAARTMVWGNTPDTGLAQTSTHLGKSSMDFFVRVPPNQPAAAPGGYGDELVITFTY